MRQAGPWRTTAAGMLAAALAGSGDASAQPPAVLPADAPKVAPVDAPKATPADAPKVSPIDAPKVSPTDAPKVSPTDAPKVAPSGDAAKPAPVAPSSEAAKAAEAPPPAADAKPAPAGEMKPAAAGEAKDAPSGPLEKGFKRPESPKAVNSISFSFNNQEWEEVFQFLADQTGRTLRMEGKPEGKFVYYDSRKLTLSQATDVINGVLYEKGYALVQKDNFLVVLSIKDGIRPDQAPLVKIEELATKADMEFVQIQMQLKSMPVDKLPEEFKPLRGNFGQIIPIPTTNSIIVVDIAKNVKQLVNILKDIESADGKVDFRKFKINNVAAVEVERVVRDMLGLAPRSSGAMAAGAAQPQQQQNQGGGDPRSRMRDMMRGMFGGGGGPPGGMPGMIFGGGPPGMMPGAPGGASGMPGAPGAGGGGDSRGPFVSVDERTNTLLVSAQPNKLALVEQIVQIMDVKSDNTTDAPSQTPRVEVYAVPAGLADGMARVLQGLLSSAPDTQVTAMPDGRSVIVRTTPREHEKLTELFARITRDVSKLEVEVLALRKLDATTTAKTIKLLFGQKEEPSFGPVIEADAERNRLIVRGSRGQIDEVRGVLAEMGEAQLSVAARNGKYRVIPIKDRDPQEIAETFKRLWSRIDGEDSINVEIMRPRDAAPAPRTRTTDSGTTPERRATTSRQPDPGLRRIDATEPEGSVRRADYRDEVSSQGAAEVVDDAEPVAEVEPPKARPAKSTREAAPKEPFGESSERLRMWTPGRKRGGPNAEEPIPVVDEPAPPAVKPAKRADPVAEPRQGDGDSPVTRRLTDDQIRKLAKLLKKEMDSGRISLVKASDERAEQPPAEPAVRAPDAVAPSASTRQPSVARPAEPAPRTQAPAKAADKPDVRIFTPRKRIEEKPAEETRAEPKQPPKKKPTIVFGENSVTISADDPEQLRMLESFMDSLLGETKSESLFSLNFLKAANASDIAPLVEEALYGQRNPFFGSDDQASKARIIADTRLNALLVVGPVAEQRKVKEILKVLDTDEVPDNGAQNQISSIALRYATADDVVSTIKDVYADRIASSSSSSSSDGGGFFPFFGGSRRRGTTGGKMAITAEDNTNTVWISAPKDLFEEVAEVIERLDDDAKVNRQVTRIIKLKNVTPEQLEQALGNVYGVQVSEKKQNQPRPGQPGQPGQPGMEMPQGGMPGGFTPSAGGSDRGSRGSDRGGRSSRRSGRGG